MVFIWAFPESLYTSEEAGLEYKDKLPPSLFTEPLQIKSNLQGLFRYNYFKVVRKSLLVLKIKI